MAAKSYVHSVAVNQGAIALAGGFPDVGSETWTPIGAEEAFATFFGGSDALVTLTLTGEDPYAFNPPEVAAHINNTGGALFGAADGEAIRTLPTESIVVRVPVLNPDAGGDYDTALHWMLESCCVKNTSATITTDVDAAGANDGEFDVGVGEGANFTVGEGLEFIIDGAVHHKWVTKIDSDTITVTPEKVGGFDNTDVARHGVTYAPREGAVPTAKLINLRFDTAGLAHFIFHGEVIGIQTVLSEKVLYLDLTIRPGNNFAVQSTSSSVLTYTRPVGAPAADVQACRSWSAALSGIAAGAHVTPVALNVSEHQWGVTFTGAPDFGCGALITESSYSFSRSTVSLTGTTTEVDEFPRHIMDRESRHIVLSYGPPGRGMGIATFSAHLSEPETRGQDDNDNQTVSFNFRNGGWAGDQVVVNDLVNTSWRLFFPNPDA